MLRSGDLLFRDVIYFVMSEAENAEKFVLCFGVLFMFLLPRDLGQ